MSDDEGSYGFGSLDLDTVDPELTAAHENTPNVAPQQPRPLSAALEEGQASAAVEDIIRGNVGRATRYEVANYQHRVGAGERRPSMPSLAIVHNPLKQKDNAVKKREILKVKVKEEQENRTRRALERKASRIIRIHKFEKLRRENEEARMLHESQALPRNNVVTVGHMAHGRPMSPELEQDVDWVKQVSPQKVHGVWEQRRSRLVSFGDEDSSDGEGGDGLVIGRLNSGSSTGSGAGSTIVHKEDQSKKTLSRHSPVKLQNRVAALGLPEGGWNGGISAGTPNSGGYGFGSGGSMNNFLPGSAKPGYLDTPTIPEDVSSPKKELFTNGKDRASAVMSSASAWLTSFTAFNPSNFEANLLQSRKGGAVN